MRNLLRDSLAGTMAATIVATYAVSYSALFVHGDAAAAGAPLALWAIMLGAAIGGGWTAWRTSIAPLSSGMDSAQAAMFAALGATAAGALAAKGATPDEIARHLLLAFSLAGLVYAAASAALGYFRLAGQLRLVPSGVVAGFLAATGIMLMLGGLRLAIGEWPTPQALAGLSRDGLLQLALALAFAGAVLALRRFARSSFALPALIVVVVGGFNLALHVAGVARTGWFLAATEPKPWLPALEAFRGGVDWRYLASLAPDAFAIACVGLISNVMKIVSLETQRDADADLDAEFRSNGVGNFIATLAGGLPATPVIAPTQVLSETGGASRWGGVICAGVVGLALALRLDLPGAIPLPVLGGLVTAMGVTQFWQPTAGVARQGNRGEMIFVVAVAAMCLARGFVSGVLLGFIAACLIFAFNYARIGVVRRRATRATVSSNVEYAPDLELYLAQMGETIHIYWLEGYVFFGSADALFKQARAASDAKTAARLEYVVLDFSAVPGLDGSALQSFDKLRRHFDKRGVAIAYAGLKPALCARFEAAGLVGGASPHRAFATRDAALEWCEGRALEKAFGAHAQDDEPEEVFLRRLGAAVGATPEEIAKYLWRRDLDGGAVVYEQGAPADAMDFVAHGGLTVAWRDGDGALQTIRKMRRNTVVGEMGFFRESARSATVVAERPAVIYTLTREAYDRMKAEHAELAAAVAAFVVRTLADRLEFANRQTLLLG